MKAMPKLILAAFAATVICNGVYAGAKDWMVVNLKTGDVSYYGYDFDTATNTFNTVEYKTVKMAFRRIEAGDSYYVQNGAYTAQMEKPYYIGIFPVTRAQCDLMNDPNDTYEETGHYLRAQGELQRYKTRGRAGITSFGADLDATYPIGALAARVQSIPGNEHLTFDLPTEAMWEVAARAIPSGDKTHKNWNWFFGPTSEDFERYGFSTNSVEPDLCELTSGTRVPGSKLPNAWGLYDVYGNVWEICLDVAESGTGNPAYAQGQWTQVPGTVGSLERIRGGGYSDSALPTSSVRENQSRWQVYTGFRVAMIDFTPWSGVGDGSQGNPYVVTSYDDLDMVLSFGGSLFVRLQEGLTIQGPITVRSRIDALTLDLNGGTITGALGQAAIILEGPTAFSATGTGTIAADEGVEAIKRPGTVTAASGVTITGTTGGAVHPAPEFSAGDEAVTTKFVKGVGNTWKLTAFAELANDAIGADVMDGQITVYRGYTVDGATNAVTPTITRKKSAVKVEMTVEAPSAAPTQFFRVKFGE